MQYRKLGRSGMDVSVIGLGCMSLGTDRATAHRLVRAALDHGITFFDTADLYDHGLNEEIVGEALRGVRAKAVIATKVGNRWRKDGSGWDWDASEAWILEEVHQSLKRLKVDCIDLYQLHGGTMEDRAEEAVRAFERLKTEGAIRAWGISSIRPNVVRRFADFAAAGSASLVSEMVQYSVLDRRPEEQILDTARAMLGGPARLPARSHHARNASSPATLGATTLRTSKPRSTASGWSATVVNGEVRPASEPIG